MMFRKLFILTLFVLGVSVAQGKKGDFSDLKIDSLRYKVGQMLMCGFNGTSVDEHMMLMVSRHFIGGVILFDANVSNNMGERNIKSPQQVSYLIEVLKELSCSNLLVAVDQEGGRVARLKPKRGFLPSRSAKSLGEVDNIDTTAYWASLQAKQLKELGFNVNFAPCVDVAVNENNPIIAKVGRAYGECEKLVEKHAKVAVDEYHKQGIITSLKHFPGHGSSANDSHHGFVDITDTFQERELEPYKKFIENGYDDIVMIGHLIDRRVDSLPASLSKNFIEGILRGQLGYDGVVATDDLNMGAITDNFEYEKALELAINAGVDMIIIGNNGPVYRPKLIEITIISIMDLVKSGRVDPKRIDQAYERIKKLKERVE